MKKLLSVILAVTFILSSMTGLLTMASETANYISFNADSSWELETAPDAMPNTIEAWINVDAENTISKITVFGNYGRNNSYIPSIELWLGRKINSDTSAVYYLPRIEYYNVKDWGFDNRAKAYYLNSVVINPGEWYHLAVSRDSSTGNIYCYLNNVLVQTVSGKAVFEDFITDDTYVVGGGLATPNNNYFRGNIASIAVYSDCRSSEEVSAIYTATASSKNIAGAVDSADTSLIAAYDLKIAEGVERVENAKENGTPLIENMWVEAEEPTDYAYSLAVVGDTQKVTEYDVLNGTSYTDGIYDYIIDNAESKSIKHVLGLGDITDDSRPEEWALVQNKTNQLSMSYSLITGNHDPEGDFNTYFGEGSKYAAQVAGHFGDDYTYTYHKFTAGSTDYLLVALGWDPSDEVLEWANEVVADHPDYSVIVTTHAYLFRDGTTIDDDDGDSTFSNNNGEAIWQKLVKLHSNIVMVIGGHDVSDRIMMSQSVGDNGNTVTQLLINPQGMDENLAKAGEAPAAMVAMLYFSENGKDVELRYYSTSRDTYFKLNNQLSFTTGWTVGQRPYAVYGGKQEPIVMKASDGEFYDDFVVTSKLQFDNFTTANSNGFQLNNSNVTSFSKDGTVYVSMELTEPDSQGINTYAYGGIGKSIKVTSSTTYGVQRPTATGKVSYNAIRTNSKTNCTAFPNLEDIAVAFWVKTEGSGEFCAAFWDTTTSSTAQKLYSDPISIESAGEYIVVIPIQNFYLANVAYEKTADISSFEMINLEVMFKATSVKSGEMADMYFDNIGIYPILPNLTKAKHSSSAVIKDNMDAYTNSESNVKQVTISADKGIWLTGNSYATSLTVKNRGDGKALCYTAKDYKYSATGFTSKNQFTASSASYSIDSLDKEGNTLGRNGTLAIWVKASRASRMVVRTNNNKGDAWLSSDEIVIPAGESIIKVPLSVYYDQDSAFKNIKKLQIDFCCIAPQTNTIGGATGTFMIDDIAIEPTIVKGDVNGDKECDARDIVRLKKAIAAGKTYEQMPLADIYPDSKLNSYDLAMFRNYFLGDIYSLPQNVALINHESYVECMVNSAKWTNKTTDTLDFSWQEDAVRHYTGTADSKALKVNYSSLSSTGGNNFYYNASFLTDFAENSVFCFWVYSEQSVNLKYSYMDTSNTIGKSQQCKTVTTTIPAGESIVEIPMNEMLPVGHDMAYEKVFQFQIFVLSNSDSVTDTGVLYLDAFGFYDSSTEFELITDNTMFDGAADTYWSPATTEKLYTGFKTSETVTFNAIDLTEYLDFDNDETNYVNNSYVSEFVLDVKQNGRYVELCRLDEIGTRTVVLDDTYTGSDFRITVTATDERFGISEITFKEISAVENSSFRNVGYFCASSMNYLREGFYDKVSGYTDIILFDYGCWNADGEFLWGSMYDGLDEVHLAETLAEIRALEGGEDLDIWFCLQDYDKTITDTSTLFATDESRNNLAQFAVDLCKKYGFAGVDIDYEYPSTAADWRNYGEFLALCGQKLHAEGYKLSAAFSAFGVNNITADIQSNLDYVNMMVYDLYDATGRHSPYSLARRFYNYFTELGFNSEQLVLGMPFYTKTLETVDGSHQFGGGGYRGLYEEYADYLTPHTNLITSTSGQWNYYFNGPDMLRDKVWYAISNNMGGVFCWSLRNDVANDNEKGVASLGQTVIDTIDRFVESIAY